MCVFIDHFQLIKIKFCEKKMTVMRVGSRTRLQHLRWRSLWQLLKNCKTVRNSQNSPILDVTVVLDPVWVFWCNSFMWKLECSSNWSQMYFWNGRIVKNRTANVMKKQVLLPVKLSNSGKGKAEKTFYQCGYE